MQGKEKLSPAMLMSPYNLFLLQAPLLVPAGENHGNRMKIIFLIMTDRWRLSLAAPHNIIFFFTNYNK